MSSSTAKCILPGELIDQVIDHLHDDLPSLRMCSLTCRTWVPSARFHIFRDVMLTAGRANAFAVLLEASPHIAPLVDSLTVQGDVSHMYRKSDCLEAAIPVIAPKLTRLKTLRVERVTLAHHHRKVLSALIYNFSALQELCISCVTFNRFRDLAALIVAHPFLECLNLGHIWWNDSVNVASQWENVFQEYPDSPSRLRCISLNDTSLSVIDWITSHYRVLPVQTVTQSTISTCEIPQMARLLRTLGSSLEHLTFCIYSPPYTSDSPGLTKADLISANTSLRTLTFDRLLLTQRTPQLYAWVPILLSQVTSHAIEEISFVLVWNQLEIIETVDLELVQDIITKGVFSGLKKVIFQLVGNVDPVAASRTIVARMDQLAERGLLVFRRESDLAPIVV